MHRRHAWMLTTVGSLVIFFVTAILESLVAADNVQGALGDIVNIIVLVTLLLAVVGLIAWVVDAVRLRRYPADVLAQARDAHAHELTGHPLASPAAAPGRLRASRHLHPPRHWIGTSVTGIFLVFMAALGVSHVPGLVDGIAYLSGAEATATFVPHSYSQECGRDSCMDVTNGVLQPGGTAVTLQRKVPLGQSLTERRPLWAWGSGVDLIDSTASAWVAMSLSLIMMGIAALVLFAIYRYYRRSRRDRTFINAWRVSRPA
jgi:hypothetical protein